jgi:hypothetical protein
VRRNLAVFAAGTLSLMTKHLTLPLVWCWFLYSTSPRRAALWMIAALALWLFTFAPTLPDGAGRIVERVFLYRSWPYGFQSPPLFYAAIIVLPFAAKWLRLDVLDALLFTALGAMTFTYGAGSNNFYPVLLFGSARPSRWLIALSISIILLVSPWTRLEMMIGNFNTNNVSWLICMVWFVSMTVMKLRVMRHMPPNGGKIMQWPCWCCCLCSQRGRHSLLKLSAVMTWRWMRCSVVSVLLSFVPMPSLPTTGLPSRVSRWHGEPLNLRLTGRRSRFGTRPTLELGFPAGN